MMIPADAEIKNDIKNCFTKILKSEYGRHATRFLLGIVKELYRIDIAVGKPELKVKNDSMFKFKHKFIGNITSTFNKKIFSVLWNEDEIENNNEIINKLQCQRNDELLSGAIFLLTVIYKLIIVYCTA